MDYAINQGKLQEILGKILCEESARSLITRPIFPFSLNIGTDFADWWGRNLWSMSMFVRSIVCIVLVIGLSCVVGCESTKSSTKTTKGFPWQKVEKEPEKEAPTSVGEFIGRDRVTSLRR
ncbi:MAG: hypothetical protein FWE95_01345 [Planctomycetaceae bacterium]|nr:hypothetical protein [Planctomycetaceae bacterium]